MGENIEPRTPQLPAGAYELLVTDALRQRIENLFAETTVLRELEFSEEPVALARYVSAVLEEKLVLTKREDRVPLVNGILNLLASEKFSIDTGLEELREVSSRSDVTSRIIRPESGLSDSALLTNAQNEPTLGAELRAELATADRVDLLSAFIRWHGIRVLEEALEALQGRGVPLRVLTTTYIGATERRALDELVTRFGAEVRINYETQSTRLHAKAWLFHRNSGFNTGYVGSSNLSHSALVDGLEWNVKYCAGFHTALDPKVRRNI